LVNPKLSKERVSISKSEKAIALYLNSKTKKLIKKKSNLRTDSYIIR